MAGFVPNIQPLNDNVDPDLDRWVRELGESQGNGCRAALASLAKGSSPSMPPQEVDGGGGHPHCRCGIVAGGPQIRGVESLGFHRELGKHLQLSKSPSSFDYPLPQDSSGTPLASCTIQPQVSSAPCR